MQETLNQLNLTLSIKDKKNAGKKVKERTGAILISFRHWYKEKPNKVKEYIVQIYLSIYVDIHLFFSLGMS